MSILKNSLPLILLIINHQIYAQVEKTSTLYLTIKKQDSLLFNEGFNKCNIKVFENLLNDDFESFSSAKGIKNSKSEFINGLKNGLCFDKIFQKRELVDNSMDVYQLENNGVMYGAIQQAKHEFYNIENGLKTTISNSTKFIHVWIFKNNIWTLNKVLSYDHKIF